MINFRMGIWRFLDIEENLFFNLTNSKQTMSTQVELCGWHLLELQTLESKGERYLLASHCKWSKWYINRANTGVNTSGAK